jgi:hypothetical protein
MIKPETLAKAAIYNSSNKAFGNCYIIKRNFPQTMLSIFLHPLLVALFD